MRVLGIDPGSNFLGLGCVEVRGSAFSWVGHRLLKVNPGGKCTISERLKLIHEGLSEVLFIWKPSAVAIEEVFFAKNAQSALKLGQARGAALVGAAVLGLPIFEYPATVVKQTVAGSGRAEKDQVQRMVKAILSRTLAKDAEFEREDVSDALAVAICHLQHRHRKQILRPSTPAKRPGLERGL
ncbi:MAG TPA: crossover junction endodeoxyribonuclease RuvC [Bdellovibrionota bacterium]|jgi:crossover junction endodeoxyribonuclease RuvC